MTNRLDNELLARGFVFSRSQADSFIRMKKVLVNGKPAYKSGQMVHEDDRIELTTQEQYVSRAGFKLASIAQRLRVVFTDKVVLDVGSSTGGFTDYALQHGAKKVISVDVGTEQLHPSLRTDPRIELHEKTDIRALGLSGDSSVQIESPDIVVIDVSFISIREILPHIAGLVGKKSQIVAMVKPQFEAGKEQTTKGVIKNDSMRRKILRDFEEWSRKQFVILNKADSEVAGSKGNLERFYLLQKSTK